jgi:hypothetical protein
MASAARRAPEGVEIRHQKACASRGGRRCDCFPSVRAHVYDASANRLVRKSFNEPRHRRMSLRDRLLEAGGWRADATKLVRSGRLQARDEQTVGSLLHRFLDGAARGVILTRRRMPYSPSTLHRMRQAAEYRLVPAFGARYPSDLTTPGLRRFVEALLEEGLSPSSIANTVKPLSAMCRWATGIGEATTNPCAELALPSGGRKRERIATPEEAARLLGLLREVRSRCGRWRSTPVCAAARRSGGPSMRSTSAGAA